MGREMNKPELGKKYYGLVWCLIVVSTAAERNRHCFRVFEDFRTFEI